MIEIALRSWKPKADERLPSTIRIESNGALGDSIAMHRNDTGPNATEMTQKYTVVLYFPSFAMRRPAKRVARTAAIDTGTMYAPVIAAEDSLTKTEKRGILYKID